MTNLSVSVCLSLLFKPPSFRDDSSSALGSCSVLSRLQEGLILCLGPVRCTVLGRQDHETCLWETRRGRRKDSGRRVLHVSQVGRVHYNAFLFRRQKISNACGTFALFHALAQNEHNIDFGWLTPRPYKSNSISRWRSVQEMVRRGEESGYWRTFGQSCQFCVVIRGSWELCG